MDIEILVPLKDGKAVIVSRGHVFLMDDRLFHLPSQGNDLHQKVSQERSLFQVVGDHLYALSFPRFVAYEGIELLR